MDCDSSISIPGPALSTKAEGETQIVVDEQASEAQRQALFTILTGGETDEAATHWWVFGAMSKTIHEPLYRAIRLQRRYRRTHGGGLDPPLIRSSAEPIRSPVTGEPHRVRIGLPNGIEFEVAEIGSGTTSAEGAIRLDLTSSYAQFNRLNHTGRGLVRRK